METLFSPLASAFGGSGRLKVIWCFLFAYPLGSLFIRIPSSQPSLKHTFNIFISVIFFVPVLHLPWGFLQLLGSIIMTYFIVANVRGSGMPWIVFTLVMTHLTINHIIREIYPPSYEKVEISGAQMILAMKLTTFAWNVYDGRRPTEDLDRWQLQKRVTKYPTLLEFLGFSFYYPGVLYGPNIDYGSYASMIEGSWQSIESTRLTQRAIPYGRKRAAYRKMLTGLMFLGLFAVLIPSYSYTTPLTPWFAEQNLPYRFAIFQFCGIVERCKFYAIWMLTEGASILTGLGFSGFGPSGESLWEGAANIKILEIEIPANFKGVLNSWNINTNIWLRECVYKRVTPKDKRAGLRSTLITCIASAFWHGFSAGYYLTFIYGGLVTYVARKCRAGFRPLVLPPPGAPPTLFKRLYDFLGVLFSILLLNFTCAPFRLLTFANTMEAWSRLGWYGFWIVGCGMIFFHAGGSDFLRNLQNNKLTPLTRTLRSFRNCMPPGARCAGENDVKGKRM